jgi:hypothetical protein
MLLSTLGYLQILSVVEQQYFHRAEEKIAGNEDEIAGNLLLRLPLEGPYGRDDDRYISVRGEVTVEGQLYHFVKKKVYRDTLYIVCLEDEATTLARKATADYSQSLADQPHPKSNSAKKRAGSLSIDYILSGWTTEHKGQADHITIFYETPEDLYRCRAIGSVFRPPCYSPSIHC